MSKVISVNIDEHLVEFIETQINAGVFNSASEVVQSALLLLEMEEEKRAKVLAKAIEAGEKSGLAVSICIARNLCKE